jgi:hypothetical protein
LLKHGCVTCVAHCVDYGADYVKDQVFFFFFFFFFSSSFCFVLPRTFRKDVMSDFSRSRSNALGLSLPNHPQTLLLRSSETKKCDEEELFSLTIPLSKCLNNHDFSKVDCAKLHACIGDKKRMAYEDLVQCSGAPSMRLSVFQEVWFFVLFSLSYCCNTKVDPTTGRLRVLLYPLSRSCSSIPIPLHFARGSCASTFAVSFLSLLSSGFSLFFLFCKVSAKCGIAGSALDWE